VRKKNWTARNKYVKVKEMKVLITGAKGYLGSAIASQLFNRGDSVHSISRKSYKQSEELGITHFRGDIRHYPTVIKAATGCEAIIHVAAKTGIWGSFTDYYRTNVIGTQNVVHACRELKITKLVYTSSPSVIFNGKDMESVNETAAYPDSYDAYYPQTKAQAEKIVLSANDETLGTVSLRPHLIWGPGDPNLVGRIISKGKNDELRRIGEKNKFVDSVYIDNAAKAHLLALDKIFPGSICAGKVYFISNGEPMQMWDLINRILKAAQLDPVKKIISKKTAYNIGYIYESFFKFFHIKNEPRLTCFLVKELSTSHWFDISAARKDLGYSPGVTIDEGLNRLEEWFQKQ
jgi:2-alkyl-3-oxoalkanoate reductase